MELKIPEKGIDKDSIAIGNGTVGQDNLRIKPVVRQTAAHVIKLKNCAPARPESRSKNKCSFPVVECCATPLNLNQLTMDILFMFNVVMKSINCLLLHEHSAVTKVLPLMAKEPGPLLNGVSIPNTQSARHVGDRQALDRESSIHRLSTDKDPSVLSAPIHYDRPAFTAIHFKNLGSVEGPTKRSGDQIK